MNDGQQKAATVDGSHAIDDVGLTVGRAARLLGLAPSALRYYDDIGLVPADKDAAGYRRYRQRDVKAVALVRAAQDLGFSLDDIRELMRLDPAAREARRALAQEKIAEIDRTTAKLVAVRSFLEHAQSCTCHDPAQCQASSLGTLVPAAVAADTPAAVMVRARGRLVDDQGRKPSR